MRIHLSVALLVCASIARAGVETAPVEQGRAVVTSSRPEALAAAQGSLQSLAARKSAGGASLRCWQNGRLIFEEPVASVPPAKAEHTYAFEGKAGGAPIQVIDMLSAICLVK